jgi:hypothetical protein
MFFSTASLLSCMLSLWIFIASIQYSAHTCSRSGLTLSVVIRMFFLKLQDPEYDTKLYEQKTINIRWICVKLCTYWTKEDTENFNFNLYVVLICATFCDFINIIDHHNFCKKNSWQFMKGQILGSSNTQMQYFKYCDISVTFRATHVTFYKNTPEWENFNIQKKIVHVV